MARLAVRVLSQSHWAVGLVGGAAEIAALAAFLTMIAFVARGLGA